MYDPYDTVSSLDSNASGSAYTPYGPPNGAVGSQGDAVRATSPDRTRNKCATVTMMLAERIIRNDWSVEDEHFFESNHMNVWQTIEFLSGLSHRRRYNYEGYSDTNNSIRTLTPSWRRDSFVEKNVNPNVDESSASQKASSGSSASANQSNEKYAVTSSANVNAQRPRSVGSATVKRPPRVTSAAGGRKGVAGGGGTRLSSAQANRSKCLKPDSKSVKTSKTPANSGYRRRRTKKKQRKKELDPEYALSPSDYSDLIKCT